MNPPSWINDESVERQVEFASCECCGLTEECTQAYIRSIREDYKGKWICGLCAEAINYEMRIKDKQQDEALIQHMSFCNKFKSPPNPALHLLTAIKTILRRSFDSPTSMPNSPTNPPPFSPDESPSRSSTQHECQENDLD